MIRSALLAAALLLGFPAVAQEITCVPYADAIASLKAMDGVVVLGTILIPDAENGELLISRRGAGIWVNPILTQKDGGRCVITAILLVGKFKDRGDWGLEQPVEQHDPAGSEDNPDCQHHKNNRQQ